MPAPQRKVFNGSITIGENMFFARSSWEANCAAYFEFLKQRGDIKSWQHEPKTFWFEKIKRGVRSYLPDFFIEVNENESYFVEVKGYMDSKSLTKLRRMKIYYPAIKIEVIDGKRYNAIKKTSYLYPDWGKLDAGSLREPGTTCTIEGCTNKRFRNEICKPHFKQIYGKPT